MPLESSHLGWWQVCHAHLGYALFDVLSGGWLTNDGAAQVWCPTALTFVLAGQLGNTESATTWFGKHAFPNDAVYANILTGLRLGDISKARFGH
jgi:hypothetical protein